MSSSVAPFTTTYPPLRSDIQLNWIAQVIMYRCHILSLNEEMSQFLGDKFQKPATLHHTNSACDLVTLANLQTHSNTHPETLNIDLYISIWHQYEVNRLDKTATDHHWFWCVKSLKKCVSCRKYTRWHRNQFHSHPQHTYWIWPQGGDTNQHIWWVIII